MLISVITISISNDSLLQRTYHSIESSASDIIEFIFVISKSSASINELSCLFPKVSKFIVGEDSNIPSAWNVGISSSTGKNILILNAGDTYSKDFIDLCLSSIHLSHKVLIGTPLVYNPMLASQYLFNVNINSLWRGMHIPHEWLCIPRSIYSEVGLYSEVSNYACDYEFILRLFYRYNRNIFLILPATPHGYFYEDGLSSKEYYKSLKFSSKYSESYSHIPFLRFFIFALYYLRRKLL